MSIHQPVVVDSPNISTAWGAALLHAYHSTDKSRTPLLVCISGFSTPVPDEDTAIRAGVDIALRAADKVSVETSGAMIFPYDFWVRRGKPSSRAFSEVCVKRLLPRLKARDQRNRFGTYFERMMGFTGWQHGEPKTVDQLSFVIDLLNKETRWPRKSALQIGILDPAKDHTGQSVRGFPCLQQVSLTHDGDRRIAIHAFYPTQYIFDRGYGNYLGLCHLGAFIAHETGLIFSRLNCFVGEPQLGEIPKKKLHELVQTVQDRTKQ